MLWQDPGDLLCPAECLGMSNAGVAEQDDIWDDASDDPVTREWTHRKNRFHKIGYRDGIAEGQKDSAQEGFNLGFRQSVQDGHKRDHARGITRAFSSLPDSLGEKLMLDAQCRELHDLHFSVQEISAHVFNCFGTALPTQTLVRSSK